MLSLIATSLSGFAPLQVPRPELLQHYNRLTNRVLMKGSDDGCEMVTLEAHASAVFRKHHRMEAWICPEDEIDEAKKQFECLQVGRFMFGLLIYVVTHIFPSCHCLLPRHQVMHEGHVVWACNIDPVGDPVPETWFNPSASRTDVSHAAAGAAALLTKDDDSSPPEQTRFGGLLTKLRNLKIMSFLSECSKISPV